MTLNRVSQLHSHLLPFPLSCTGTVITVALPPFAFLPMVAVAIVIAAVVVVVLLLGIGEVEVGFGHCVTTIVTTTTTTAAQVSFVPSRSAGVSVCRY